MIDVVVDRRRQRLGRQERWPDGGEPTLEVADYRTNALLAVCKESGTRQTELFRLLLFAVHGADKGAAFCGENGLGSFGVLELAPTVVLIRSTG